MPSLRTLSSTALSRRLWVGQLAWLIAVFGALAPTVSYAVHAAASRDAADLHAVCSSAFERVTSSAGPSAPVWWQGDSPPADDSSTPASAQLGGHCRLCLLSIDRLAPPRGPPVLS